MPKIIQIMHNKTSLSHVHCVETMHYKKYFLGIYRTKGLRDGPLPNLSGKIIRFSFEIAKVGNLTLIIYQLGLQRI